MPHPLPQLSLLTSAYLPDLSFSCSSNDSASVISLNGVCALLLGFLPVALPLEPEPTPKAPELYSPDAGMGVVASSTLSARVEIGSDEDVGWEARNWARFFAAERSA